MARYYAHVASDCVACGSCTKVCPYKAISVYKGMYAIVDREKCIGCGKCIKACPAAVIERKEVIAHEKTLV